MKKQVCRCLLTILILYSFLPCQSFAVSTSATAAILVDAESGRVLYEQNADRQMLIASTTKIMTAMVAITEGCLTDQVKVSRTAACTEGSSMYLKEGESLRLETLLYGLMLCSGNDAAVAIAEHVGGSVQGFVDMMNETARSLGMLSTSFANPNGLDHEEHYSTARDMARLACAAVGNPTLLRIASTKTATMEGRTMTNHNKLLSYQEGCIGLKTGYTRAAGRTLVSCAEKDGQRLVAVTLQDGNDWADHQALFSYGFSSYPQKQAAYLGQVISYENVAGPTQEKVPLIAADYFSWPLAEEEQLEMRVELDRELTAPLNVGQPVGRAVFILNGTEVGAVRLLCGTNVLPEVRAALRTLKLEIMT